LLFAFDDFVDEHDKWRIDNSISKIGGDKSQECLSGRIQDVLAKLVSFKDLLSLRMISLYEF
jgi:hypothetical protein